MISIAVNVTLEMINETSTWIPSSEITTPSHDRSNTIAVAGVIVGVVAVLGALLLLLYYFTKYKNNRLDCWRKLKRRTWSTGSNYSQHNPLEPDETDISDLPPRTARQLFSITDNDDDGFIYDEIFDASEFTDEKTKKSIRHLYSAAPTRDEIPDLNLRI